jgi:hypothetical protein
MTDRTNGESAFHVAGIASIDMISTAPNAEVVPLKINAPRQETKSLGSDRPGGPHDLPTRNNSHPMILSYGSRLLR